MSELVAAVPELLRPEQAAQHAAEAVQTAVAACAEDTAGQTCYICYGEGDEDEGLVRGCACRGDSGFAHVSCLARGAQAADERDADTGWARWSTCRQCGQDYHGVVSCALGWACWKTYVGRPETDKLRGFAISVLGNGLSDADRDEDALSVREADLAMMWRVGAPEEDVLSTLNNLANTYRRLGRDEEALAMRQEIYSGRRELNGEEHEETLKVADNYAMTLLDLERFEEAKSLLRKVMPVARRVLGESSETTLMIRWNYAKALYRDDGATLDDVCEAVTTLEDAERIARRVFGGSHPTTLGIEQHLRKLAAIIAHIDTQRAELEAEFAAEEQRLDDEQQAIEADFERALAESKRKVAESKRKVAEAMAALKRERSRRRTG